MMCTGWTVNNVNDIVFPLSSDVNHELKAKLPSLCLSHTSLIRREDLGAATTGESEKPLRV